MSYALSAANTLRAIRHASQLCDSKAVRFSSARGRIRGAWPGVKNRHHLRLLADQYPQANSDCGRNYSRLSALRCMGPDDDRSGDSSRRRCKASRRPKCGPLDRQIRRVSSSANTRAISLSERRHLQNPRRKLAARRPESICGAGARRPTSESRAGKSRIGDRDQFTPRQVGAQTSTISADIRGAGFVINPPPRAR